jgi:hypothetical protein
MRARVHHLVGWALVAGSTGCFSSDACPKFAHIVGGDFGRSGDVAWWTLQVEELPAELTFNQRDVPAGFLEYRWAVDLDSDRDGDVDLRVSIDHFAVMNGIPVTVSAANLLSQTNENLREVAGGVATVIAPITGAIAAPNVFRFQAPIAAAPGLAAISDREQSTWLTVYRSGAAVEDQCDERFR